MLCSLNDCSADCIGVVRIFYFGGLGRDAVRGGVQHLSTRHSNHVYSASGCLLGCGGLFDTKSTRCFRTRYDAGTIRAECRKYTRRWWSWSSTKQRCGSIRSSVTDSGRLRRPPVVRDVRGAKIDLMNPLTLRPDLLKAAHTRDVLRNEARYHCTTMTLVRFSQ